MNFLNNKNSTNIFHCITMYERRKFNDYISNKIISLTEVVNALTNIDYIFYYNTYM